MGVMTAPASWGGWSGESEVTGCLSPSAQAGRAGKELDRALRVWGREGAGWVAWRKRHQDCNLKVTGSVFWRDEERVF